MSEASVTHAYGNLKYKTNPQVMNHLFVVKDSSTHRDLQDR